MTEMEDELTWDGRNYRNESDLTHPSFAERFPFPNQYLSGKNKNWKIDLNAVSRDLSEVIAFLKSKRSCIQEREISERQELLEANKQDIETIQNIQHLIRKNYLKKVKKCTKRIKTKINEYTEREQLQNCAKQFFESQRSLRQKTLDYLNKICNEEYRIFVLKYKRTKTFGSPDINILENGIIEQIACQEREIHESFLDKVPDIDEDLIDEHIKRHTSKLDDLLKEYEKEYETRMQQCLRSNLNMDCEYIVSVSLPHGKGDDVWSIIWNNYSTIDIGRINTELSPRWVFIPSSDRYNKSTVISNRCAEIDEGNPSPKKYTISIFVVRPSQYAEYYAKLGNACPIIQLPDNIIGVGYARYWIVKIAKHFNLEKIWICDDTVAWFKEYKPVKKNGRICKDPKGSKKTNLLDNTSAFKKIEGLMEQKSELAVISPRRQRGSLPITTEFTYKPPGGVCLLNIKKIGEKNLNYRPELLYMEDMIFALECKKAGLQVCVWNAIVFYARNFTNTGANMNYNSD